MNRSLRSHRTKRRRGRKLAPLYRKATPRPLSGCWRLPDYAQTEPLISLPQWVLFAYGFLRGGPD